MNITREDLESVRDALCKAQRCLTIYQQADVALDLNDTLAKIEAILKEKA
jgi:hypothetical protein